MYVDVVKVASGNTVQLAIGTHDIVVSVNPGFTGTTFVTFDGKAVTGGEFTITADMYKVAPGDKADSKASIVLSATGDIATVPDTVIDNTGDEKDEGLGLTDILLIVLVVLIVIMAVIVALRMMRS